MDRTLSNRCTLDIIEYLTLKGVGVDVDTAQYIRQVIDIAVLQSGRDELERQLSVMGTPECKKYLTA